MDELNFTFSMPDDESLAKYISIKGEKGDGAGATKTSELINDSDFTTNAALTAGLATKADLSDYEITAAQVDANTSAISNMQTRRISFYRANAGNGRWYKLTTLSASSDTGNSDVIRLHGKAGGVDGGSAELFDIAIVNRDSAVKAYGDFFAAGLSYKTDFVAYEVDDGLVEVYMKVKSWVTVDIDISCVDCTIQYDGNYVTTEPEGTLVWSLSEDTNVQKNINATISANIDGDSATVNGHTVQSDVPYNALFTDTIYDDSAIQSELDNKANSSDVAETYATKSAVETDVASLSSQISALASGAPLTASSTSGMTDTTKVYVNTTDGYWYYYNGTTWVSGGVYQSSVTDTNAMQKVVNDMTFDTLGLTSEVEWTRGGVDATTHKLTNVTDRIRNVAVIHAKKGSYLTLTDTTNYRWKICKFSDIQKNYTTYLGDVGTQNLSTEPTKVLDEDCYIVINVALRSTSGTIPYDETGVYYDITSLLSGKIYYVEDEEEPLDTELYNATETFIGHYWGSNGAFNDGTSGSGFNVASRAYRVEPNHLVKIINKGNRTSTNVGCFLDKNERFVEGWNHTGVHSQIVPANAKYMCLSLYEDNINDFSVKITKIDTEIEENNYRLIYDDPKIKLIAHRGLNDLAPEATIPAYTLAGEAGMWGCKIDICETMDGYFVCSHDSTVDRMFDGTGSIYQLTLATIQNMTVDAGSNISQYPNLKIVQLYEALEICKRYNMHPFIEFKYLLSNASVARVIEIIRSYGLLENTVCQCSDGIKDYLYALREVTDVIPISYWLSSMDIATNMPKVRFLGNAWLSLNAFSGQEQNQFEAYAGTLRSMHLPLHAAVLTKNQINYAKKWIKEYGLDMLVTSGITYEDLDY